MPNCDVDRSEETTLRLWLAQCSQVVLIPRPLISSSSDAGPRSACARFRLNTSVWPDVARLSALSASEHVTAGRFGQSLV